MAEADIDQKLQQLTGFVTQSRETLAAGGDISLEGMEKEILALCEAVRVLPREQARDFMPQLTRLLTDINALAGDLKQQRDALESEIQGLDQHKKAAVAYTQRSQTKDDK